MSNPAERDRIKESRCLIWMALIGALAIQVVYESTKSFSGSWPFWITTTMNVLGDIMPNVAAAAGVALVIGWWISEYPREKYLTANQSAREVIRDVRLRKRSTQMMLKKLWRVSLKRYQSFISMQLPLPLCRLILKLEMPTAVPA
jgi:hypothetical protein